MSPSPPERAPEDLTAKARIRDAAMVEFGEHGGRATTIRSVAARAGVSPALVQHHFGTKAALRAACDAHVLAYLDEQADAGLVRGAIADHDFLAELYQSGPAHLNYLARALTDGSPAAAAVFDQLVEMTETYLVADPDPAVRHTRAAVLVAMRLGMTVLHAHLSRAIGADAYGSGAAAVGRAVLDLLDTSAYRDLPTDTIRKALDTYERRRSADPSTPSDPTAPSNRTSPSDPTARKEGPR